MATTGACVWCGKPAEGNYSIHRDGFGEGPEVPLCDEHGSKPYPTLGRIWMKIAAERATGDDGRGVET